MAINNLINTTSLILTVFLISIKTIGGTFEFFIIKRLWTFFCDLVRTLNFQQVTDDGNPRMSQNDTGQVYMFIAVSK